MATVLPIYDQDNVLRRIPILPNYIKPDGSITSYAYRLRPGERGISVNLERLSSYRESIIDRSKYKLLSLNVGCIRNTINDGLDVIHDPIQDANNPENANLAHSLIIGDNNKSKQRKLSAESKLVLE